ncbi:rod shape-determining protein RodA [Sulfurospirillum diekertiae]|uniref:Peptidoglycan glycosyltransferase MrdB n=1 Tax=Sulfurospirillum diekertiae TaxID=1854492 RepID=A0A1Y0HIR6_9BACT|nr:FtsW/RodA/SpoVE family cell cycle protein [Sulfurospirillum diekertiae]ARU47938.1 Peptidoglycan glycosyltransferase MrdB [Sulfurospirillum diekertiae]QIR76702.1 rod shape-determining protein RodA [Sulfurospirillum diekertiae]QIR79333.1 rod shape-determining protein RodA [Sulfurospirillum diekertiae]
MFQIDRRILTHFDFLIPILVLPIIVISYYLIAEANTMLANKQIVYYTVGFVVFLLFFIIPIKKIEWVIPFFYWVTIILLLSVDFFGIAKLGARRWLEIPFVHFTIQPSEIFKPAFILMLAYLIKNNPPEENGYGWKSFFKLSFYILLPFVLVAKEPDLGTAMVLVLLGYGTLFVIGVHKKIWITLAIIIGICSPLMYNSLHDYQKQRITDFISEKPSYHVKQSIIAIGSGGLTGKERSEATQTHYKFLPIATSDFIFAYTVERLGFWGALGLIVCYASLVTHLLSLNFLLKEDYFARVITSGISLLIFFYMSINIAMTIGLAPVVGVPLPFYSYGGSSFITFFALFGILENLLAFRFDPTYRSIKYSL